MQLRIKYFLECVDNDYYAVPNRIISKKEQSGWRFKVKDYYKRLNNILPNSSNGNEATSLLIEIFKRLSIGTNHLLFTNWETFRAIGLSQYEYYDTIIKRILYNGYTKDNLQKCINLLTIAKSPYELSDSMFMIFIDSLKTVDVKEISLELLQEMIINLKNELKGIKDGYREHYKTSDINNFIKCVTIIYFDLDEYEKGKKYFHKNYIERDMEIKEYVLLDILENLDLDDEWLKEYESKQGKIEFRNSINERYNEIKKL